MKILLFLVLGLGGLAIAARGLTQSYPENDIAAAKAFKSALEADDRKAVSEMIDYPLRRPQPLPSITSASEFLEHWDEYFDEENLQRYGDAQPEEYGWRGINLANGCAWFSYAKIWALNCRTDHFQKVWEAAKAEDNLHLHESAQGYDRIRYFCQTEKLKLRVQDHGEDMRYIVWDKNAELSENPELVLHDGKTVSRGSGGNHELVFENPPYRYEIDVSRICGEDCNDYLYVYKGEEQLLKTVCDNPRQG